MTIPWIITGPDIQENHVVGRRISTMDTAATVLDVLGLSLAGNALGRPVTEAYKPQSAAARRHLAAALR